MRATHDEGQNLHTKKELTEVGEDDLDRSRNR